MGAGPGPEKGVWVGENRAEKSCVGGWGGYIRGLKGISWLAGGDEGPQVSSQR